VRRVLTPAIKATMETSAEFIFVFLL
jgi:hypothetical protein